MQSFFQYRRLRQEVQVDLAIARQIKRPLADSPTNTSTDMLRTGEEKETRPLSSFADTPLVPGVTVSRPNGADGSVVFVVGWKDNDPNNPQQWTLTRKWMALVTCCVLAIALTIPTSVEGPTQEAFNKHFGVEPMAGSMTTGIFLIGVGVGSLFAGPFSETFGRNAIYFSTMILVMLFIMAKALAPNFGAALAFRFLCALFAATPMTVTGGTMGDILTPMQIPFGLPFGTFCAYAGPILGPVIGAYTPEIGFAWADWISMIIIGAALVFVLLAQPETYSPLLLEWKAKHLRDLTGDDRYRAEHASASSLGPRLLTNLYRPFTLMWTEPIILIFTFYLVLLYFVLFTFLNGYSYIFTQTYGISTSLTFIIWAAMLPGVFIAVAMIPYIYHLTKKAAMKSMASGRPLQPEVSLYWAMAGASILMPISLFWMAWTCYSGISIWSPIIASGVFGYALVCIFTTSYMYIIFVYLQYAASALGFMTFARYVIAGALTPASIRMYDVLGPHWALTIVAIIATVMAPVPYVLYKYGHKVRAMSKNVQNRA
ncbi:putative efflux pump kojT [Lachnellula suecica]|uniref:Putative efflux pump kojT n=1 Tax=Lachnellula suecica TaxID=602035 RepID=A0A8T9C947_9HELO|nr:putative efflux pump kojT [Lachnellula suecica]